MKLGTRGRYAVMALVDLARHSDGRPVSLAEIAERQEISVSYLEQLFAKLRRCGLVRSVRGPGGGYLLAHPASETRIGDIILAVDEPIRATRCASDGAGAAARTAAAASRTISGKSSETRSISFSARFRWPTSARSGCSASAAGSIGR